MADSDSGSGGDDDDLFADSDDTAELMASGGQPETKPAATKKKAPAAATATAKRKRNNNTSKNSIPDADNGNDDDSDDDDDKGLFDSDDDDDEAGKKPAAKKKKIMEKKPIMSKRERMEALQKKKRAANNNNNNNNNDSSDKQQSMVDGVPKDRTKKSKSEGGGNNNNNGADDASEDSYDSREFQLNDDDRNFIDTEGDDADALNELYSEQHFDDVRGEAEEDRGSSKKKKGGGRSGGSTSRGEKLNPEADLDNPIMAAVHKMKKKKREARKATDVEEEAKMFMDKMESAAEQDELAVKERRPATKKLSMINEVMEIFMKRDMTRILLDLDVLSICKRWIQPLPNGQLGNVTVRQRMLDSISKMTGEFGITPTDLKRSEFGKVVMSLYMHKSETPAMKRQLKALIEQWSRPIFQKSGNMRDLERVERDRGHSGIAGMHKAQKQITKAQDELTKTPVAQGGRGKDFESVIKNGKAKGGGSGLQRVRVPYSKGFQYSVRPESRDRKEAPEKGGAGGGSRGEGGVRDNLKKRMMEKGRAVSKNQRSANISIEGRVTKG